VDDFFQKRDANKRNAAKSTGPRPRQETQREFECSQARILLERANVPEPDRRDFETLRESLLVQLAPRSALQHIGFEQIVTCCWRCKLAIRLEMHRVKAHVTASTNQRRTKPLPNEMTGRLNGMEPAERTFGTEDAFSKNCVRIFPSLDRCT